MANIGFVQSLLNGLPDDVKRLLAPTFQYVLDNLQFGHPDTGTRARNFQIYFFNATTPAAANTEFSIHHGLQTIPTMFLPFVPLDQVGAGLIPLEVTRIADTERLYLKSSSTNAVFTIGVEL